VSVLCVWFRTCSSFCSVYFALDAFIMWYMYLCLVILSVFRSSSAV
jgi:hypothetical protein